MKKLLLGTACLLALATPAGAIGIGVCGLGANNYYGYCRTTGGPYTSISGTFQSPVEVNNGGGTTFGPLDNLDWVGIGASLSVQVQAGVAHQLNAGGSFTYQAFYGKGTITQLSATTYPIRPGDLVTPSLLCTLNCVSNTANMQWTISITDVHLDGTSWNFTTTGFVAVEDLSWFEIMLESPQYGGHSGDVPNFGLVPFKNILVNGSNPNLISSEGGTSAGAGITVNVSAPSASGDGFVGCAGDSGTFANCDNTPTFVRTISGGAGR